MKIKTIFLCASMYFYKELVDIEAQLLAMGFAVNIPVSAQRMKDANNFDVAHFKGTFSDKQKGEFIRTNFKKILKGDAILVINNTKNGISGYIGPNVLMEIGLAYAHDQKIYLWNPFPSDASYADELRAVGVDIIDQEVKKIIS